MTFWCRPSTPFWQYGTHPFFPHAQTISILSDLLYSLTPFPFYSKYNNNKHNLFVFYKRWKKYNEIQLIKNKTYLNNRKIKNNHPPSPAAGNKLPNQFLSLIDDHTLSQPGRRTGKKTRVL